MTCLNEVLSLGLGNQRLKFGGSKGVDKAGFGDDQEENLSASQDRELVGLHNSMMVSWMSQSIRCRRNLDRGTDAEGASGRDAPSS